MPAKPSFDHDVRMRGFTARSRVEDGIGWIDHNAQRLPSERVCLLDLGGRVLASDIVSPIDIPGFDRAMMDGYAVHAADTLGADAYNRLSLQIIGSVFPGSVSELHVSRGQAVRIMTGAPLPAGADAVIPAEHVEAEGSSLFVLAQVSPGKHVGRKGEDIECGCRVLAAGRKLLPHDMGVLASIGAAQVAVVRRPRVRLVVTGDELLPPGSTPAGSRIVDSNSPMLTELVRRDGGIVVHPGIVPDRPDAILAALHDDSDIVLVSGGSSVGQEDLAPVLLARHGELAIHGIAMRPSSPMGMGRLGDRLVFLLPGNPVSCLCGYDFFAGRAIRVMGGLPPGFPHRSRAGELSRKLASTAGRVDYARVRFHGGKVEPLAISGASVLSSTTRADGFVIVPEDSEGYNVGTVVTVWLYG